MKIYVGDYWKPFPRSEYGGLFIYAANNKDEVVKLAMECGYTPDLQSSYGNDPSVEDFKNDLREIGTTDKFQEPQIIDAFET